MPSSSALRAAVVAAVLFLAPTEAGLLGIPHSHKSDARPGGGVGKPDAQRAQGLLKAGFTASQPQEGVGAVASPTRVGKAAQRAQGLLKAGFNALQPQGGVGAAAAPTRVGKPTLGKSGAKPWEMADSQARAAQAAGRPNKLFERPTSALGRAADARMSGGGPVTGPAKRQVPFLKRKPTQTGISKAAGEMMRAVGELEDIEIEIEENKSMKEAMGAQEPRKKNRVPVQNEAKLNSTLSDFGRKQRGIDLSTGKAGRYRTMRASSNFSATKTRPIFASTRFASSFNATSALAGSAGAVGVMANDRAADRIEPGISKGRQGAASGSRGGGSAGVENFAVEAKPDSGADVKGQTDTERPRNAQGSEQGGDQAPERGTRTETQRARVQDRQASTRPGQTLNDADKQDTGKKEEDAMQEKNARDAKQRKIRSDSVIDTILSKTARDKEPSGLSSSISSSSASSTKTGTDGTEYKRSSI